jgi:hypothetical protein
VARKLIPLPGNHVKVIVGELAPLFFRVACELFPVPFNDIPIDRSLLSIDGYFSGAI